MSQLNYNIYSNINDNTFLSVRETLIAIESKMNKSLSPHGWRLGSEVANNDGLAINFVKNDSNLYGNIYILFEDKPNRITFEMGVTKSFDEDGYRYFYKKEIFGNKELYFFKEEILDFTELLLKTHNSLYKNDIKSMGEKITLRDYKGW